MTKAAGSQLGNTGVMRFALLFAALGAICVLVLIVFLKIRNKPRQGNEESTQLQRHPPVGCSLSNLILEENNGVFTFLLHTTFQSHRESLSFWIEVVLLAFFRYNRNGDTKEWLCIKITPWDWRYAIAWGKLRDRSSNIRIVRWSIPASTTPLFSYICRIHTIRV